MPREPKVDAYLAALPADARECLEGLRALIHELVPDAEEAWSYQLPTFKYRGKILTHLGAAKNHCAVYGSTAWAEPGDLDGFDSSKGTIRFSPQQGFPPALLQKLLAHRIAEIEAAGPRRRR